MKIIQLLSAILLLTSASCDAQIKDAKTATVKIAGNCGMCESTIEKAGTKKKVYKTSWNVDTKTAEISYDSTKTDLDEILKQIALAGYDNERFVAPVEAYNKLHGCCQYDRENISTSITDSNSKEKSDNPVAKHDNNKNKDVIKQDKNHFEIVLNKYFDLKDALVKSNASLAVKKSAELLEALNEIKMETLEDNIHLAWMKQGNDLKNDAQNIAGSKAINKQRDRFVSLSEHMYELVKVSKPEGTVYYDHCPMYNDNKGANWLSKEKEIKNPYYGNQMLTCGKIIEKIK